MNTSYVYVVGVSTNPVKIGHASDVASRLCSLQIGCPDELVIHKAIPVIYGYAEIIERASHKLLSEHRRRGEWYNVDADVAISVVMEVKEKFTTQYLNDQERQDQERDIFQRMEARTRLERIGPEAVEFYQSEWKVRRNGKAIRCMNSYILKKVGLAPLELFKRVVINGNSIEALMRGDRGGIENAYIALAQAVNALAGYYHHRKTIVSKGLAA